MPFCKQLLPLTLLSCFPYCRQAPHLHRERRYCLSHLIVGPYRQATSASVAPHFLELFLLSDYHQIHGPPVNIMSNENITEGY